ncbi:MAG: hypothetical protein KME30_00655 [Iphinoe sp. HA4291-MV1]|nr:hypothetical protein [Iphinoe sp. HA4291-MV1]
MFQEDSGSCFCSSAVAIGSDVSEDAASGIASGFSGGTNDGVSLAFAGAAGGDVTGNDDSVAGVDGVGGVTGIVIFTELFHRLVNRDILPKPVEIHLEGWLATFNQSALYIPW